MCLWSMIRSTSVCKVSELDMNRTSLRIICAELHAGFHTHPIVALSVATRRTLLATASRDNTVRVWDYHRQISIATYQADNPVNCVALHPWGTDVIISFHESAFTYVVGGNDLIKGQRLAESASGKLPFSEPTLY
jgi:WD40 repeat protein